MEKREWKWMVVEIISGRVVSRHERRKAASVKKAKTETGKCPLALREYCQVYYTGMEGKK